MKIIYDNFIVYKVLLNRFWIYIIRCRGINSYTNCKGQIMLEYLGIGSSPYGEDCAQVGSDTYYEVIKTECRRYIELLNNKFDTKLVSFCIKGFPHDFGTYYEVCIRYDRNNEDAENEAYEIDNNLPEFWE